MDSYKGSKNHCWKSENSQIKGYRSLTEDLPKASGRVMEGLDEMLKSLGF